MTSSLASNGTSVSTSDREQNGHEEHGLSSAAESRYRQLFEAIPEAAWVIDVETLRFLEVNDTALRRYGYTREEFLTLTALDIRPQEERSTFRALYQSLDPAQRHVGPLKHQRRDGSQIDVIVTSEQIELDGRAARLVIAVDVTEQQRLAEETRRQAARLQVLATASRTFGEAQHDINAVLDTVTRTISDVIGDGCVVRLMSTDGKWLRPVAHHHPVPELHQLHRKVHLEHRQGVNEGINGQVMRTGRPAFYPTINPKQQKIFRSPLWKPFEAFGVHSLIAVPLRARGRTFGTIFVFRDRTAESYTRSDLRMLEDLADRAALAIDSARLILGNRALEARFRAAVEGSTDAFTIFETVRDDASEIVDFAVSYANPESIRMFGCSRDEVIGRPISELYTDRYFSRFFERYREVAEERTTFIEEFSVDLPEAGRRWFWHQVVPLADGLAVTANDITARKCGEDAARQLAAIVAASDDGIMSVGLDRTILTWNAGAERMYGYTAEEIIGQPVTVLVPPDRAGEIDDMLQRLSRGESIVQYPTERVRKDGSIIPVSLTLSPLRDAEGMIVGSASIVRDLTEWRRAEEELRQSEARYRSLARHFPNGTVTLFDHECRYQLTDGAGWTTATFNRDAMPGRTLREVFPPEIVDVAEPAYLDALAGNASRFTIVWNGVTHDVQVVPVRDDAGIVVGGLAMSQATDPNREAERISPDSLFC